MSDETELNQDINNQQEETHQAENQNVETDASGNDNASNEQEGSQEQAKTFTPEDINRIVEKRLAREKEEREALQQRFDQLTNALQNFGKPQQQEEQSQEQYFDPNQPLTYADLHALQQQAQQQEIEAKRTAHFSEMANQTLDKYKDFKEVTKGHAFTKAIMENKVLADSLETLDKPFEFMYDAVKAYPNELEAIAKIQDPRKAFAEVVRLEAKIKQNATVPNVTGAPGIVSDDHEESNVGSTRNNIQELRNHV